MTNLEQSALAPMSQFDRNNVRIDENNQSILDEAKARYLKILDDKTLKKYKRELARIQAYMDERQIDVYLGERQQLEEEFNQQKLDYYKLKDSYEYQPSDDLFERGKIAYKNLKSIQQDMTTVKKRLHPYRKIIINRDILRSRIDEHEQNLLDTQQEASDRADMEKEANIHAELMIRTWNRLGYKYEITRNNKLIRRSVKFERIIATPDEIQYKIDISRLGLIDGTVHNLPQGVRAYNLVEPDTLRELSAACERDIVSPNIDGECDWSKGVWLRLFRQNYSGGLMEKVSFSHVMKRYPYDDHDLMPIPMGVKAGRYINWVNLADHPHFLFAGQTGSGKTNSIRVALSTLCEMQSPQDVRFALIDLKRGGDLNPYERVPHAMGRVIKTVEDVATLMKQLEILMHQRMEIISPLTNDIVDYNHIVSPTKRLPRILIIFDEYSAIWSRGKDLGKEIEMSGIQIATQARAAGIHLLIGIQQSYSDSIHKQIKGNITFVLGGRQRTMGASMSVFNNAASVGVKKIPGRMLCDDGTGNPYQVQIPFLSKEDLNHSIAITSKWGSSPDLWLPGLASDEEGELTILDEFGEDMLVTVALQQLDGFLHARQIWEIINRHDVSLNTVLNVARDIRNRGCVEYRGTMYRVETAGGRSHKLVEDQNHEIIKSHP